MLEVTEASNAVIHGLEVKADLDTDRRWVTLRGPKLFSLPTRKTPEPAFLNWYAIRKPQPEANKTIRLTDAFSGKEAFTVSAATPAFFVMPAQRLIDGPPADVPESLNHFLAFEIADPESLALPEPVPGKPRYVCVPAEEWHHEEHFPIKDPTACLMVYEADSESDIERVSTIDQFGINKLDVKRPGWICVPGRLIP